VRIGYQEKVLMLLFLKKKAKGGGLMTYGIAAYKVTPEILPG
jgi:hypothetical protein